MQSADCWGDVNALSQRGVGIHTAVSIGNAAVIGYGPLAAHLIEDDEVRAVAMYVDTLASMDELIAVARRAQELEKPIVLCVGGRSDAGSVAVQSHTGALATSHRTLKGVATSSGSSS